MTKKERIAILTIFISVLGFSFVSALKPVMISYAVKQGNSIYSFNIQDARLALRLVHYTSDTQSSKMVDMLSEVLGMSQEDVYFALEGGTTPSELLMSEGVFLTDLEEEYSFDIVGDNLVRFRA